MERWGNEYKGEIKKISETLVVMEKIRAGKGGMG